MYLSIFNPKILFRVAYLFYIYFPIIFKIWFYGWNSENILNLKKTIIKSGSVFIKFTQWLIQRPDILNENLVTELRSLQTYCQSYSFNEITEENSLQFNKLNLIMDSLPIGVGSIAQVHKAKFNGKDVIVKMRHPKIQDKMKTDLTIIYWIMKLVNFRYHIFSQDSLIKNILDNIYNQIFLSNEKKNLDKIDKILKNSSIKLPQILYDSDEFIIETFCPGQHINSIKSNTNQYINTRNKILEAYIKMIKNGFIHGDLHDGNILCDGTDIYLIDFGMAINLKNKEKWALEQLLLAYDNFYRHGLTDGLVTCAYCFTEIENSMTKEKRDELKQILLDSSFRNQQKGITLIKTNQLYELINRLINFFSTNRIYISDNILYVFLILPIIEANITTEYNIDFFGNMLKNMNSK
jgi:predicted unusual protein kinase regulating ubiquinone biosynthesis (AarF/ABC1/UbiB family)